MAPVIREASHAGSWYTADGSELSTSLSGWLKKVDATALPLPLSACNTDASSSSDALNLPIKGCRAIIGPHAGYSYSGPAAAYAYRCIDTAVIKRIFILGPSHHVYLDGCALSQCDEYETPLGNLELDKEMLANLTSTGDFSTMSKATDEDEHSLEMHLPYIYRVFHGTGAKVVPIMIGAINTSKEQKFGRILAPYLANPENFFVVSSDFCHWGSRFSYTYYRSGPDAQPVSLSSRIQPEGVPIHESIRRLDEAGMHAIEYPHSPDSASKTATQARDAFAKYIKTTRNTVCGRHPIGVLLAALAEIESTQAIKSECRFTRYEQSSPCLTPRDSSVSYASAFVRFLN
ncbi:UPF0103-domain-containing protein [Testicularia cyperi]|uniref:UPF0103-domain-containing protein n=1 Tax=Testicularia cyperi TaxID=1882483 RepID=A0A317XNJ4_9BASI|nr:UPF0103-domain-containing protein [Testicularia cyperi]